MMTAEKPWRPYNAQRAERMEEKKRLEAERRGKVIRFLRENPLSTSEEIFAATGCGPGCANGFLKAPFYNGRRVWRIDQKRLQEFLEK